MFVSLNREQRRSSGQDLLPLDTSLEVTSLRPPPRLLLRYESSQSILSSPHIRHYMPRVMLTNFLIIIPSLLNKLKMNLKS